MSTSKIKVLSALTCKYQIIRTMHVLEQQTVARNMQAQV